MRITAHRARIARLVAASAILLLPATAQLTVDAPAAHAVDTGRGTPGFCPDGSGVTVIVDFQELGGTTIVRCAPGDQATGLAALKNAGIRIAGVARWGEAFVCRVEGKPSANVEPCIDTPPASAYWSYWHAPNGGSWTYSQWGVLNRKPPVGSFEGWSFSKNKTETSNPPPRVAPARPAPKPTPNAPEPERPRPEQPRPEQPRPEQPKPEQSGPAGNPPAADGTGTPDTGSRPVDPLVPGPGVAGNPMETEPPPAAPPIVDPSTTAVGTPPETGAPAAGQPSGTTPAGATWTGGEELARTGADSAMPITTLIGIALLAVLCAGAAFTVVRRRRATSAAR
ncbi:LPXTG cell wall anchor domain-containing protein [Embleya sp. NPDC050493]|uniref:LPXTG cell wall anchor domain-containing protein n=1 Tax=Embleya sp. NPDC050493 TaxID=3363989 RepID=UPI003790CF23